MTTTTGIEYAVAELLNATNTKAPAIVDDAKYPFKWWRVIVEDSEAVGGTTYGVWYCRDEDEAIAIAAGVKRISYRYVTIERLPRDTHRWLEY